MTAQTATVGPVPTHSWVAKPAGALRDQSRRASTAVSVLSLSAGAMRPTSADALRAARCPVCRTHRTDPAVPALANVAVLAGRRGPGDLGRGAEERDPQPLAAPESIGIIEGTGRWTASRPTRNRQRRWQAGRRSCRSHWSPTRWILRNLPAEPNAEQGKTAAMVLHHVNMAHRVRPASLRAAPRHAGRAGPPRNVASLRPDTPGLRDRVANHAGSDGRRSAPRPDQTPPPATRHPAFVNA
jgi:hypothetical protein